MSNSHEKQEVADEEVPLNMMAGSGEQQQNNTSTSTSCYEVIDICGHDSRHCSDRYHRKLAIASIICGISCIGIKALIASVKAEKTEDQERADQYLQRARRFSIISIITLLAIIVSFPLLMGLVSYLLTLYD